MNDSSWPTSVDSWLDPRLEIRPSVLGGRGTFAREPIRSGEKVIIWVHRLLSREQVQLAPPGLLLERSHKEWIWQPPDDLNAPDNLLNHSCSPYLWMKDEVTLSPMNDIQAGDELTIDYAVFVLEETWIGNFDCKCGTRACRRTITGKDWRIIELQHRYAGHFHSVIEKRIAEMNNIKTDSHV